MIKKIDATGIALLALLAFPLRQAGGQPVVSDAAGSWEHEQQVTVTGSGFGVKARAAPLKWDDFEEGTPGAQVGSGWYTDHRAGDYPLYADDQLRPGSGMSVKQDYVTPGNYNCSFGLNTEPRTHYFISFYQYARTTGTGPGKSRNYKIMSLRGGPAGNWDMPEFRHDMYPQTESGHSYYADCDGTVFGQDWGNGYELADGVWVRFDYDIELRGPDGLAVYKRWKDGQMRSEVSEAPPAGGDCAYTNIYINGYWAQSTLDEGGNEAPCPDGCPATFWLDDVYMDSSRARVDLCDAASWSSKEAGGALCELQIPAVWSDTSITLTVNRGALPCPASLFLYVVDENGEVNEDGYPVDLAGPACVDTDGNPEQVEEPGADGAAEPALDAAPDSEAHPDAAQDPGADAQDSGGGGGCGCRMAS